MPDDHRGTFLLPRYGHCKWEVLGGWRPRELRLRRRRRLSVDRNIGQQSPDVRQLKKRSEYSGGRKYLLNLQRITLVCSRPIIRQGLRANELMIRRWRGDDIAMARNLAGKARNRTRNLCPSASPPRCAGRDRRTLVNLAEDYDPREACMWVIRDGGVVEEDAFITSVASLYWTCRREVFYACCHHPRLSSPHLCASLR